MRAGWAESRHLVPAVAIGLYGLLSIWQADQPLHLDNMDFPAAARAAAETGRPTYYRGEENPRHSALYHPPLYVYVLALWFNLFGAGPPQARLFGALCAILLCWVTTRLARTLLGPREWAIAALWPVFLLQAFTLQASAILDIDTSIYGPLLVLLITAAVRVGRPTDDPLRAGELVLLVVLLALTLWAKLTTVWLVVAALPVLLWPRLRAWRSLAVAALVAIAGVGLFLASYFAYGRLIDADIVYTFQFLVKSFLRTGKAPAYADNFRTMAPSMLRWTGVLPWAAALLAFSPAFARRFALGDAARLQFRAVLALALVGSGYYMAQTRSFGHAPFKYVFVFWPLVLLPFALLAGEAARVLVGERISTAGRLGWLGGATALLAVAFFLGACVYGDSLLLKPQPMGGLPILWLPALAVVAALGWRTDGRGRMVVPLLWLAATAVQVGFQAGIAAFQAQAPHSTSYDYGQRGITETIAYVRRHTRPDELITSMKDVGFQADRKYIENYPALVGDRGAGERLVQAAESGRVALMVFTEGIGQDQLAANPALARWVAERAPLVARFGNYRIYRPLAARGG